jgi:two-component system sensor histidine kinase BaeS
MVDYVNTKEIEALKPVVIELSEEYSLEQNWLSMAGNHDKFRRLITRQLAGSEFSPIRANRPHNRGPFEHRHPQRSSRPPPRGGDFLDGKLPPPPRNKVHYALLDKAKNIVVGLYIDEIEYSKTPIMVNDDIVGFFAISKRNQLAQGYEVDFIKQQQNVLWLIALIAMSLVTIVTFPLARHLVEPIKLITCGMHKLTQGDYQQAIQMKRKDELGELSRDYNELAITLAQNESARKRWLANISHELRTPVAILRGELEAMLDEVRPLTKDNITSVHDEVKHLQRLIDDLNLLTSADIGGMRYRKQDEELSALIQGEVNKYYSYLADAGIKLNLSLSDSSLDVYGDKTRLCQLFENIINNCIKYSSATELNISLAAEKTAGKSFAVIKFEDNGIGVDDIHLSHLFEHLYRVENSRNRKTGGSGLGLSICRHIVMAHQGEIFAQQASIGGLAIIIKLPVAYI